MTIFGNLNDFLVDKKKLKIDLLKYSADRICMLLLEKDKGGPGSTGSAMTMVELLISTSVHVHIVDCADTQLDLATPYLEIEGVTVHVMPNRDSETEHTSVMRALTSVQPGEVMIVQYPSSSIERIEQLHKLLVHAQSRLDLPVDITPIWTMDSDRNSRDLLELMLDSPLPGTMQVNWPVWNGEPHVSPALAAKIASQGGRVFSLPALDRISYRAFKADGVAPRQRYLDGDFARQMEHDLWLRDVAIAIGASW